MRLLVAAIDIDAPAERVFAILTDLPRYADWNPFIVRAEGTLALGQTLRIRMHPPGAREQPY